MLSNGIYSISIPPDEEYVEKLQNALEIAQAWLENMSYGVCGTPDYNNCWHDCSARDNVIAHEAKRLHAKMHKALQ